jgi:hypothetical protein
MVLMWCGHEPGSSHRAAQCVFELASRQLWGWATTLGVIKPDQGMEVHQSASLELSDLAEAGLHPNHATDAVEFAVEGLGGTPPQLPRVNVPHHRARVVEATDAQRFAECLVRLAVGSRAREEYSVRADLVAPPARSAR